jgi:hypothetical protein
MALGCWGDSGNQICGDLNLIVALIHFKNWHTSKMWKNL